MNILKNQEIVNLILESSKMVAEKIYTELKVSNNFEYSNGINFTGDSQLKIDLLADSLFSEAFSSLDIGGYASEEQENINYIDKGNLFIGFDPLDGSSMVGSNLSIGSIIGIYDSDFSGINMIASFYFLYGIKLELVLAFNKEVSYFQYDKKWNFVKNIKLNDKGNILSPGGINKFWSGNHRKIVDYFFNFGYRLRYSGCMVADLHQILLKEGGLFAYPIIYEEDKKSYSKLRAVFEVWPFAFIFENAGGKAIFSTEELEQSSKNCDLENMSLLNAKNILTSKFFINDKFNVHTTISCFIGSKNEILKCKEMLCLI